MERRKKMTKTLLSDSLKVLMRKKPFEKITIKMITDEAGVIRPTFYNYFCDKYEVLEYIFNEEIVENVKSMFLQGMHKESIKLLFTSIKNDSEFYSRAFMVTGQNSFEDIVRKYLCDLFMIMLDEDYVRPAAKPKIMSKELVARYYAVSLCDLLKERGVEPEIRHISNSACIMELPRFHLDAVRAGITIYGIYPSDEVDRTKLDLRPVMALKSRITYIKEVPEGFPVSYGGTFVTSRPSRIATVPVGYGDGYPRLLSNKADVLIRGHRAPIVGRVCMDQLMVDVTGIEAEEFDEVTLLGRDGAEEITVDELGRLSGRFPYEFVCDITPRVPRVYVCDPD